MTLNKLFIYGTLRGLKHTKREPGTIKGKLYRINGFPMLIEDHHPETNYSVHGSVYTIPNLENNIYFIDRYEGCRTGEYESTSLYHRKRRRIKLDDGGEAIAFIYIGNKKRKDVIPLLIESRLIKSGYWNRKKY